MTDQSQAKLSAALVAASAEMPAVAFDATNPFLHNRFASLGAVIAVARPILAKHGLAVMQFACSDSSGRVGVRTRLLHQSGEFVEGEIYLDVTEEKGKSRAQVAGSIITYLRRYAQSALLNLYADEDTDGNAPAGDSRPPASKPASTPASPPKVPQSGTPGAAGGAKGLPRATEMPAAPPSPEKCKVRFLQLIAEKKWEIFAWDYFIKQSYLLPTERLVDLPLDKVPLTSQAAEELLAAIKVNMESVKAAGGVNQELDEAYTRAHVEDDLPMGQTETDYSLDKRKDEPWRSLPIPKWSKHFKEDGFTKFGELDKEKLWWWAVKWAPTGYKGNPPKPEDVALRSELDKVRDAYGFTE